ncbi:MAG TPA: winged helix-turn-helix domain-containing protein [Pyrinomonadaceae bacterium]|nr:winged helix-turn-helix domain-containing protein [Pyrinomonadaceae bacterium]
MSKPEKHFYEFGPFRLDPAERLLLREDSPVPLTPKAFDTLVVLVGKSGHLVGKDELMREVWGDSFVEENNLDKSISALRKALGEDSAKYIATVRGAGYRFMGTVHESTAADSVVLQERTRTHILIEDDEDADDESIPAPKIIKAESQLRKQETAAAQTPRTKKWPLVALIVCSILFGLTGLVFFVRARRSASATPSPPEPRAKDSLPSQAKTLAVLPFKPLVGKTREPYLEMGIADSLITRLSNVRQLVVRPTSAVQKFNQPERDPAAAGRELGVETVLDGSIQRQGDRLRVTVQLVSVKDGSQLWGRTFDEKFTNIFAMQDAISLKVAEALALNLSGEEQSGLAKRSTENPEAYELYLKGRYFWKKFSPTDHLKAAQYFNQAIAKDPTYALAYSGLGDTYGASATNGWIAPSEGYPKAMAAVKKALELDETLAESHCALGALTMFYLLDWAAAEREYQRAIELNPNYPETYEVYSFLLAATGRLNEALEIAKRGLQADPLSVTLSNAVGGAYYLARRYDEAIKQFQKTNDLNPHQNGTYAALGFAYDQKGMYAEAIASYQKGIEISESTPSFLAMMGHAYAASGRRVEALKLLSELKQMAGKKHVPPYDLAILYTGLGEKEKAFEQLDKAIEERSGWVIHLNVEPLFDPLRSDQRYEALLKRINLAPLR